MLPGQRRASTWEPGMTKTVAKRGCSDAEVLKLRSTQKKLHKALKMLFDLLELYSPNWYDKRFHDLAKAALTHVQRTGQQFRSRSRD